ncbi:MAG: TRAP transporter large permease subunit [Candidatus Omnitrophota bacterium]|jgi:Na+/H+ antiporter NhaD/arsenite permease-like protein|nr:MAG: TRAP transporter large permease subunit [Candidatus Omnitrophota bacterium]
MDPRLISITVFILAYLFFVLLPNKRSLTAAVGASLLILTGVIPLNKVITSINWNVMGIFVGMLFVADIFMKSRVPAFIAEVFVNNSKNTAWAILFICALAGFISAFVENVATVLIIAPIALSLARKLKISPVNMMIAIAVSSNLQGTATLIGDPPSMLLAGFAKMNFMDFIIYKGKPGIFFAVELGGILSFIVLYMFFRKHKERVKLVSVEKINSWIPTIMLVILIMALAISSFWDTGFSYLAGIICMIFGILSLIWDKFVNKAALFQSIKSVDWDTTIFLIGIFIIIGSLTLTGWIDTISTSLSSIVGDRLFFGYTIIVVFSVIISGFVDNVPFLATMLPVAISMSSKLNIDPSLFLFGLLIGASLGGNITPIGASANIVACGLLKKEGYKVTFGDFMKIGLPFTIAAVFAGYLFIWFVWGK